MREKLLMIVVGLLIFIAYGVAGEMEFQDAQRGYVSPSIVFVAGR